MAKKQKEENIQEVKTDEMTLKKAIEMVETPGVHVRRPQPGSTAERQLLHFAQQPKVRYRYPRGAGEKPGSFETSIINDLLITVEKGVSVDIPEDIATNFDSSLNITDAALNKGLAKNQKELD